MDSKYNLNVYYIKRFAFYLSFPSLCEIYNLNFV